MMEPEVVTFEFEDTAVGNGVTQGNVAITFSKGVSVDAVVAAMKTAIDAANLGLQPQIVLGTGQLILGDDFRHLTDVSNSSLTKIGVPGGTIAIPVGRLHERRTSLPRSSLTRSTAPTMTTASRESPRNCTAARRCS